MELTFTDCLNRRQVGYFCWLLSVTKISVGLIKFCVACHKKYDKCKIFLLDLNLLLMLSSYGRYFPVAVSVKNNWFWCYQIPLRAVCPSIVKSFIWEKMFMQYMQFRMFPKVFVGGISFIGFSLPLLMLIEKHSWPKCNITFLPLPVGSLAHPEPCLVYDHHLSIYIFFLLFIH